MQKLNCVLSLFLIIIVYSTARAVPLRYRRAFSYIANETACTVDHIVYKDGDPIPTDDPCESCKCRPPGFSCVLRECEVKTGCKAIRRAGECCPQYQCGCEHNGNYYGDGDRIPNAESPCYSCYCQGSSITCSLADCKFRFDCEPEYVLGECCPRYDHCPPENIPSVTVKSTIVPILTTLFAKTTPMPTTPSTTTSTTTEAPITTPVPTTVAPTTTAAPITKSATTTTTPLTTASSPSVETVPPTLPIIVKEVTTTQQTVSSEVETLAPTKSITDSSAGNPTSEQTSPPITKPSSESSSTEYSTANPSKELSETKATTESTTIAQTIRSDIITELSPTTAPPVEDINKQFYENTTNAKILTTSLSDETTTAPNLMTTTKIPDTIVSSPKSIDETVVNISSEYPTDKMTTISDETLSAETTEKSKEPEESSTQIPIVTTIDTIEKKIETQDLATEATQKELIPTELTTISSDGSEKTTLKSIDDSKIETIATAKEESQTEPTIKAITTESTKLITIETVGPQDVVSGEASEPLTIVTETVTQSIGITTVTAENKEVVTEISESVTKPIETTQKSAETPEKVEESVIITTQSAVSGQPTQTMTSEDKTVTEADVTPKTVDLEVTTIQTQTEKPSEVTQTVTDIPNPKITEQTEKIPEIPELIPETTETSKIVESEVTTIIADIPVTEKVTEIFEIKETVTESPTEKSVEKVSEISSDLTTVLSVEESKEVSTDSKITPTESIIDYSTKQSATDSVTTVNSIVDKLNTEFDGLLEVITTTKPETIILNSNQSKPISDQNQVDFTSSPKLEITTESSKASFESISRDLTKELPTNGPEVVESVTTTKPEEQRMTTIVPELTTTSPVLPHLPSSDSIEEKEITVTDKDSANSEELKNEEIATIFTTISDVITASEESKETVTTRPLIITTGTPELTTTQPNSSSVIDVKEETIISSAVEKIETTTQMSEELSATSHRFEPKDIKSETTVESVETSSPKLELSSESTTQKELAQDLSETTTTGPKQLN